MKQLSINELENMFKEHKKWIGSLGREGIKLNLDEIDLRNNYPDNENYEQGYVTDCIFDNRKFKEWSFYLSKLYSSSFKSCKFKKIDFTKAFLSYADVSNSTLYDVNFNKCELDDTNFSKSQFTNTKITNAFLYATDLRNVKMYNVDLSYSYLESVLVEGIMLKNVVGFETMNIVSIDIGESHILTGTEAKRWLECRNVI